jgi:hypothetical protein
MFEVTVVREAPNAGYYVDVWRFGSEGSSREVLSRQLRKRIEAAVLEDPALAAQRELVFYPPGVTGAAMLGPPEEVPDPADVALSRREFQVRDPIPKCRPQHTSEGRHGRPAIVVRRICARMIA